MAMCSSLQQGAEAFFVTATSGRPEIIKTILNIRINTALKLQA
jgi:hypothetical protein